MGSSYPVLSWMGWGGAWLCLSCSKCLSVDSKCWLLPGVPQHLRCLGALLLCLSLAPIRLMGCPGLVLTDFARLWEQSNWGFEISRSQRSHQTGNGIVGSQVRCLDSKPDRHFVHVHTMGPGKYLVDTVSSIWAMKSLMPICWIEQTRAPQTHAVSAA